MSSKKKRRTAKKAGSGSSKEAKPEGPFYRPFADLPPAKPSRAGADEPASSTTRARPQPRAVPTPASPFANEADDQLSFERLMSGVVPLDEARATRVSRTAENVDARLARYARTEGLEAEQRSEREALSRLHALVEEGSRFEVVDDGRRIEGRRRGIDGGLIRRVRHGEVPINATLDLHGMRVSEARKAVEAFVGERRVQGDRVVLVVHGRGQHSPGGYGVLRGEVAAWLAEGSSFKHVAAFLTAPPEHGGEGALCVILAHPKETHRGMR